LPGRDLRLVVFLRGVNVGGHRTFRPTELAAQLKHLGCQSIGAAGTFVFHRRVPLTKLRAELKRRLPFDAMMAVCHGENVTQLVADPPFDTRKAAKDVVRFVSVLIRTPAATPSTPMRWPATGQWLVRVLAVRGRFIIGEYRRNMKTISYLGGLDKKFDGAATTRNWNTFNTIARVLDQQKAK
jgi:uncharacterized protein (DUF1697 family)